MFFFVLGITFAQAQTDLSTKLEYDYFPQESSDNSFRRFRFRVNYPIKMAERMYLVPGFEYRNVELKFADKVPFEVKDLQRFQSFTMRLTYTFGLKNDWRFAARGGIMLASNFVESNFMSDDLIYTGGIYLIKDRNENEVDLPWRIIVGIHYSTKSGRPFPLPVVNYFKTINEKWEYTLGVPATKLTHYFDKKNAVVAFATLDGFYANIQNPIPLSSDSDAKKASDITMTVILGGLGYEHYFTDHLLVFGYAGYTIYNDIRLRDHDKENIYTINDKNSFYGQVGLEFKL